MCEKCRLMELLDRELERWEMYDSPTPPSREERIEKATIDLWCLAHRREINDLGAFGDAAHTILTELMEGKP